jgi:hypothetical protein
MRHRAAFLLSLQIIPITNSNEIMNEAKCPKCAYPKSPQEVNNPNWYCKLCGFSNNASGKYVAPELIVATVQDKSQRKSPSNGFSEVTTSLILFILCFVIISSVLDTRSHDAHCSATESGLLDNKYTIRTTTKLFIPISKSYDVTYTYVVNNQKYSGHDSLSSEPNSQHILVHYNPKKPSESVIEPISGALVFAIILLGVLMGCAGIFILKISYAPRRR